MAKRVQPVTETEPRLPAVAELGRLLAQARAALSRFDNASLASDDVTTKIIAGRGLDLMQDRAIALEALIATLPAKTLADAAVQLGVAYSVAETIEGICEDDYKLRLAERQLQRILVGALPVVAAAAGLDLDEMNLRHIIDLRAGRFPDLALEAGP